MEITLPKNGDDDHKNGIQRALHVPRKMRLDSPPVNERYSANSGLICFFFVILPRDA